MNILEINWVKKAIAITIAIACVRCISLSAHQKLPYIAPSFARVNQGDDIWISSYLGEVSSFGYFLKRYLTSTDTERIVVMPEPGSTGSEFIKNKLWGEMLSMFLYPSEIEIRQKENLILNHDDYVSLVSEEHFTENYLNPRVHRLERRFYMIRSHQNMTVQEWGIFVYSGRKSLNYFFLPLNWKARR